MNVKNLLALELIQPRQGMIGSSTTYCMYYSNKQFICVSYSNQAEIQFAIEYKRIWQFKVKAESCKSIFRFEELYFSFYLHKTEVFPIKINCQFYYLQLLLKPTNNLWNKSHN